MNTSLPIPKAQQTSVNAQNEQFFPCGHVQVYSQS